MASARKIIDEIRRLSPRDRRVVVKHLEQLRMQPSKGTKSRPAARRSSRVRPYAALLELAGRAHSSESDVSTNKYRHLATAYADKHSAS